MTFDPLVEWSRRYLADSVDEAAAIVLQTGINRRAGGGEIAWPDVFEHAHRHKHIESAANITEVILYVVDLILQTFRASAFTCIGDLTGGDIVGSDPDAIVFRQITGQAAPAATRLDNAIPGLEREFSTHQFEFGALSLLERQFRVGEIRARVLSVFPVEPQLVEIVAQIVMRMNVLSGSIERVSTWAPGGNSPSHPGGGATSDFDVGKRLIDFFQGGDQVACYAEPFLRIEHAESVGRFVQRPIQSTTIVETDDDSAAVVSDKIAVPKLQADRGATDQFIELLEQPAVGAGGCIGRQLRVVVRCEPFMDMPL